MLRVLLTWHCRQSGLPSLFIAVVLAKTSVLTQQRVGFGGAAGPMDTDGMLGSRDMLVFQGWLPGRSPVVGSDPQSLSVPAVRPKGPCRASTDPHQPPRPQ